MKTRTHHSLALLLCSFIVLFLFACGSYEGGSSSNTNSLNPLVGEISSNSAYSQNPIAGTWVSGGYSLTFKSDNTYLRDFNHEGIPAVRGTVTVSGNVIIVTDFDSCIGSTTGRIEGGSYTYTIIGNTLTFNVFHDPCSDRAAFLGQTYTKQ